MRRYGLLLALLVGAGCATRGTIKELGRPEFAGTIPDQVELTLIEPKVEGQFQAYPRGGGQGDYHCRIIMEEAPHFEGENVVFVKRARPTGDQKIKVFDVVAWPLLAKHVIRFKNEGHPPGVTEPIARQDSKAPIPGSDDFGVIVRIPRAKLKGFDQIGVSSLVQYEDGWISIIDEAVLAPVDSRS